MKKKKKKKKKKRNFTPKLNEKLYLPIFAKMIGPKHFQIKFCNNTKTSEKNCLSYFGITVSQSIIVSPKLQLFSASYQLFLVLVLRKPKANLRSTMRQDRLSHLTLLCIERAYVNIVDIEKVTDEF